MNKNKLRILALALLGVTATASANYEVIYGKKEINGENINFVMSGKWLKADSLISDWTDVTAPTGCTAWSPDPSTVNIGTTFEQTATNCTINQKRTVQNREQNDYTHAYRNVGAAVTENKNLSSQTIKRTANGTKSPEECADDSVWTSGSPAYGLLSIVWKGVYIGDSGDWQGTTATFGQYNYRRDRLIGNYGSYRTFTACRTPK